MRASFTRTSGTTSALLALLIGGSAAGAADFGSPPSGEIPILFNDHTVYARPDMLKQARVLAALVKDGEIYVPLRSMFEAMGATVSASADGSTITADKPGVSVSVTLGKPEVIINGESRPLDVPPMLYHGVTLVPVRVLSEALGAYVQWVPDRRIVVVRNIPPPPPAAPPTAAPTAAPTAPPTPVPVPATAAPVIAPPIATPTPVERSYTGFVQAAYSAPNNFNEFVAGGYCDTYILNAVFAPKTSAFALKADFRQDTYVTSNNVGDAFGNRYTQFATYNGGTAFTPVFLGRQNTFDVRLEYRIAKDRVYAGIAYLRATNDYGYPALSGVGAGLEKLPDLRPGFSFYGSAFYYPNASGTSAFEQQFQIIKYDVGVALVAAHVPVYLFGGYAGDRYIATTNAPINQIHEGPYIGLGVKI